MCFRVDSKMSSFVYMARGVHFWVLASGLTWFDWASARQLQQTGKLAISDIPFVTNHAVAQCCRGKPDVFLAAMCRYGAGLNVEILGFASSIQTKCLDDPQSLAARPREVLIPSP